jgi:hypothetical protein
MRKQHKADNLSEFDGFSVMNSNLTLLPVDNAMHGISLVEDKFLTVQVVAAVEVLESCTLRAKTG